MKHPRTILGLAAAALLLAAGPIVAHDHGHDGDDDHLKNRGRVTDEVTRTLPFRSGDRLVVDIDYGHVRVNASNVREARINVTTERGKVSDHLDLKFDQTSDGIRVSGRDPDPDRRNRKGGVTFEIDLPSDADVEIDTGGGHISLSDLRGDVRLDTGGGHIKFGRIDGSMEAETGGGHIQGRFLARGGRLETGGGHIEIDGAGGSLTLETGGGHINVGDVDGDLDARSGAGNIRIGRVSGERNVHTGAGRVDGGR